MGSRVEGPQNHAALKDIAGRPAVHAENFAMTSGVNNTIADFLSAHAGFIQTREIIGYTVVDNIRAEKTDTYGYYRYFLIESDSLRRKVKIKSGFPFSLTVREKKIARDPGAISRAITIASVNPKRGFKYEEVLR